MRFVEDHEVVRCAALAQALEGDLACQGVERNDGEVAGGTVEGVVGADIGAAHDAERQPEERPEFAFPVADQTSRRHDQDAPDPTA